MDKTFRTDELETYALHGVHLDVRAGEFVAIEGPSGSGKSTLLSILGLLEAPTRGRYELGGQDVSSLDATGRAQVRGRQIGFVFQSFHLLGDLSVVENVELPLSYQGVSRAERRQRALAALDRVAMTHRRGHLPSQLSGGQQQRVAVARAIVGRPPLLLADEPTGNLDSQNGDLVMELLRELHREGTTVCMVTHNPAYARYATRALHLHDGRVVQDDPQTAVAA